MLIEGIRNGPLHPAADVKLLTALKGGAGMFHIGENRPQTTANRTRWLTAEGFEGFVLAELPFCCQLRGQQKQQLPQLKRQAAS